MAVWAAEVAPAEAQSDDKETIRGRIVAQRLADGRTEFGWEPTGGDRVLPTGRYFPANADDHDWVSSGPVEVGGAEIGWINARLSEDGRIEFAFTPTDGEQILPPARYFPHNAVRERWLHSTEIVLQGPTRAQKKDAIVAALFGYDDAADADRLTYHDYNDFGCPLSRDLEPAGRKADCESWSPVPYRSTYEAGWQWIVRDENGNLVPVGGYIEGHSGWDIQTQTKGSEPFYSLTSGTVVAVDDLSDGLNQAGVIAIRIAADGPTVVYIHASAIDTRIRVGASVQPGDCLGRQGTTGTTSGAHVHLELRNGSARGGSGGAYWLPNGLTAPRSPSIDPIDYLYRSLARSSFEPQQCQFDSANGSTIPDGALIHVGGTGSVYVVQREFRRHVIAPELINLVPTWRWENIIDVSQAAMSRYTESRLIRRPNDGGKVYLVIPTGPESALLRHIPDEDAFEAAGCEWPAVYDITPEEAGFTGYQLGASLSAGEFTCAP